MGVQLAAEYTGCTALACLLSPLPQAEALLPVVAGGQPPVYFVERMHSAEAVAAVLPAVVPRWVAGRNVRVSPVRGLAAWCSELPAVSPE